MENPKYQLDSASFNVEEYGPHGSVLTHTSTIPEVNGIPLHIEFKSDHIPNAETPDMQVHKTQRHHVTHGEKYALLARRNRKFESTIARRANGSPDEIHGMAEDGIIDNGTLFNFRKSNTLLTCLNCTLVYLGRKYRSKPSGGNTNPNTTISCWSR